MGAAVQRADDGGSDAEIIAASCDAPERFGAIFDRHYPAIRRYLAARVAPAVAEELAADTFVAAFRQRRRFDSAYADAGPWLYGIATNLLRRARRQEAREFDAFDRAALETAAQVSGDDLDRTLDSQLLRAVGTLSREQRDVLLLFAYAELSYDEIARALGISVGTVHSRLSRARDRVREGLGSETGAG